jgi:cysteine desulfurase
MVVTAYSGGRLIYLDNAAATAPADDVLAAMLGAARDLYANPASAHVAGAAAARALAGARAEVAAALDVEPTEVLFTSGGTEADALGVLGAARAARGRHLVVSALEHPAVMRAVDALAAEGYTVATVASGADGVLRPDDVAAAVTPETAIVALMLVNNELGTLQPVGDVARRLAALPRGRRPHLHVDAVQAFGLVRLRPRTLGADSIALSAHKLHGPRGAGALWVRPGARVTPLWIGGGQERGLRGGTENLPALVGFGRAATLAQLALDAGAGEAVARRRDDFQMAALAAVRTILPAARPTVTGAPRAPHIASLAFPGLPAEPLLHALEARGVLASAGSACASRTAGPSPTLKAIGVDDDTGVLRFSLSRDTTAAELDAAVAALAVAVAEIASTPK